MKNGMVRKIILVVTVAVFLFSTAMVVRHQTQMRIGAEQAEAVVQLAVKPASLPQQPQEVPETAPETVPETAASKVSAPIQVDFDALLEKNRDVVAWIYCPDTPIHYPVVQSSDNRYYLRRLLDGSYNASGTIFMDYRCAEDLSGWNTVIYGHNMKNDSMFGTLPKYKTPSYFTEHPEIFLFTPQQAYSIRLIAGFTTPADSELYSLLTPDAAQAERLIESWISASDFASGIRPAAQDRLVTLSTCSYEYDNARYVLIGILEECGD